MEKPDLGQRRRSCERAGGISGGGNRPGGGGGGFVGPGLISAAGPPRTLKSEGVWPGGGRTPRVCPQWVALGGGGGKAPRESRIVDGCEG